MNQNAKSYQEAEYTNHQHESTIIQLNVFCIKHSSRLLEFNGVKDVDFGIILTDTFPAIFFIIKLIP